MFEKDASLIMSDSRFLNERKLLCQCKMLHTSILHVQRNPFTADTIGTHISVLISGVL